MSDIEIIRRALTAAQSQTPHDAYEKEITALNNIELEFSDIKKSIQSLSNELLKTKNEVNMLRTSGIGKDQDIDRLEKELKIAHEEYERVRKDNSK